MSPLTVAAEGAAPAPEAAPAPARPDAPPGSPLARARAAAARQAEVQTKDIPVPGWRHLVLRYGLLPIADVERYAELAGSGQTTNLSLSIETMVAACRTVLWVDPPSPDYDFEVGLDHRLWTTLDWPLPPGVDAPEDLTDLEIVDQLFNRNGMGLMAHCAELMSWMQDPGRMDPGERSGATS